jgi:HK97 family phage prohead protease
MKKQFERLDKAFHAHITKADAGVVEAIVNVFGILDYGNDIVQKGAFAKTISERWSKILVLDQHNTDSTLNAIAKVLAIREMEATELPMEITAEYPEATGGLWVRMQFMVDDEKSNAIFNRIKAGVIGEYSIGFDIIRQHYEKIEWRGQKVNARFIDEIRLFECSPVLWGMNQATATVSAKEYMPDGSATQRLGDYLAACLFKAGNYTNDDFLAVGLTNNDEHAALLSLLKVSIGAFLDAIPEDLALRPMDMGFGMLWWAAALTEESKALVKEGRVISASNAERLRVAYEALTDVLMAAGLIEHPDDEDTEDYAGEGADNAKASDEPSEQSGRDDALLDNPAQPPALVEPQAKQVSQALTANERQRLLAQINLELETLGG